MTIELKAIKIYEKMSEETTAFTASLCIDGKKVGWAKNQGNGGSTTYGPDNYLDPSLREAIQKAEAYCKELPPDKSEYGSLPMDLELYIDNLLGAYHEEISKKKFAQKMVRHMKNGILIGNENQYTIVGFKAPLDVLMSHPTGKQRLKELIAKYKAKLLPGEKILNTNIPEELL